MIDAATMVQLAREYPDIAPTALVEHCKEIARTARHHQTLCERYCNEDGFNPEEIDRNEARIRQLITMRFPTSSAIFSRDPRGATVKLVVPSGTTNDGGREGLVVLA